MHRLSGVVQHYAWGSPTAVPELLGVEGDGTPWAELWFGAHPSAPSRLDGPHGEPLDAAIERDPTGWLGERTAARFGARLPYLVKVLAAAAPLSLQVHPSAAQAAAGFARENDRGVPLDAPHRLYRDASHKPEILCALTPFDALCGFRPVDATVALLEHLARRGAAGLAPFARLLSEAAGRPDAAAAALAYTVGTLLTMAPGDQAHLAAATAAACTGDDSPWALATGWAVRLAEHHPGDVGAVVALLLNCVRLAPGEALYLDAGNLHAYLGGVGVEVMANSDNVLRGGLTPKHVDVPELLDVLVCAPLADPVVRPDPAPDGATRRYRTPAAEFALSVVNGRDPGREVTGPELLVCTAGSFDGLARGEAAVVPAGDRAWALHGCGTVHAVAVGTA